VPSSAPRTSTRSPRAAAGSRTVVVIGLIWLLLATGAGMVSTLPASAPPFAVFGLTAAVLAAGWLLGGFRAWLVAIDERWLVGLHLTRFVGADFLYLYARGELPYAFAVPGGLGDIAVASLAALLLLWGAPRDARRRAAYLAWNALGLVDILFVVVTAARLGLANPASMAPLLRLPLSLLPTFLVPLIIASHVILGLRLWSRRTAR
jgi:hypothetical protein